MKQLSLALLLAALIYSCGSDTPVNTVTNPPTVNDSLIFSFDNLTCYSDSATPNPIHWSIDTCSWNKFRFKFTGQTDDTSGYAVITISDNASHEFYRFDKKGSALNKNFDTTVFVNRNTNPYLQIVSYCGFDILTPHKKVSIINFSGYVVK